MDTVTTDNFQPVSDVSSETDANEAHADAFAATEPATDIKGPTQAPAGDEPAPENRVPITVTVIDSEKPMVLSKSYSLNANGELERKNGGQLVRGEARKTEMSDANAFADLLRSLGPHQALMYGVFEHEEAIVLSQKRRDKTRQQKLHPPVVCRVKDETAWSVGPGILMLDYDPPDGETPHTAGTLRAEAYEAVPELKGAPHVCRPSASSCIYRESDNAELRGQRGRRIYVLVKDARDIERAAKVLAGRLWLAGQGYYAVSKSGSLLERTLFDQSVFQPSRLDFAGGAKCGPGLVQRLPEPEVFNNDAAFLDTRKALPNLTGEENRKVDVLKMAAKAEVADEAKAARERWIEARISQFEAELDESDPVKRAEKIAGHEKSCRAALDDSRLFGDFVIILDDGAAVTVSEILDNCDKYHGRKCRDPLEPDYDNSRAVGKIFLHGVCPYLHSFAHGGRTFRLVRARRTITLADGERADVFYKAAEVLRLDGELFMRGGLLVRVAGNQIIPVTADWLTLHLDRNVRFETMKKPKDGDPVPVPRDAPMNLAKNLIAASDEIGLQELDGVIDHPTMEVKTGRFIAEPGYDATSKLFLNLPPNIGGINENADPDEARRAVEFVWKPFERFPFADVGGDMNGRVSRGVFLAALLTAVVRLSLRTAPGFLIDAAAAGSGKTLLALCVVALQAADEPSVLGVVEGISEEEIAKVLFAKALTGAPTLLLDNVTGSFKSAALFGFLTSRVYEGRVLGASAMATVPTSAMVMLTGNHPVIGGDLNRRILRCGLDAQMETPHKRAFKLDPLAFCRENRLDMVRACLTILMAWHNAGRPKYTSDRAASFEDWSDTIRQCVIWIGRKGWLDVDDPCLSFDAGFEADPDTNKLGALLEAWQATFGRSRQQVKALHGHVDGWSNADLHDALDEIGVIEHGKLNVRRLGRWIEQRAGRIVDGRRFVKDGSRARAVYWRVETVVRHHTEGGS